MVKRYASAVAPHHPRGSPGDDRRGQRIPAALIPLMVLPSGQGVKAVDTLVVLRGT
jgi:hypothetical protein